MFGWKTVWLLKFNSIWRGCTMSLGLMDTSYIGISSRSTRLEKKMYPVLQNQQRNRKRATATHYSFVDVQKRLGCPTRILQWMLLQRNFFGIRAILRMKGLPGVGLYLPIQIQYPVAVTWREQRIVSCDPILTYLMDDLDSWRKWGPT